MSKPVANREMKAAWDGDEGADWAREWEHYDRALYGYHRRLMDAAAIGSGDQVLDIGCGNGQTTRDAARAAGDGGALGVDLSAQMIERARALARADNIGNVRFDRADAQVHPFAAGSFDVLVSRFGAMFFEDPVSAFANVARATRAAGRLVVVAWRGVADNEWLQCIYGALAGGRSWPASQVGSPGMFGLADADFTRVTLTSAGWVSIEIDPVEVPYWAGRDGDDAFEFLRATGIARGLTGDLDEAQKARALEALRATCESHDTGTGVVFGSAGWIISALRPGRI